MVRSRRHHEKDKAEMSELLQTIASSVVVVLTPLVALTALGLSMYNLLRSARRRRQKLVNAIFYHAELAAKTLEEQRNNNAAVEEEIKNDASYTPYTPVSTADDLTYDQVIEVMEWLDLEDEEIVSSYFHSQMTLHASMQSFHSEYVRSWHWHRKLKLWKFIEKSQEEALKNAIRTRDLLEDLRLRTRINRGKPHSAHQSKAARDRAA